MLPAGRWIWCLVIGCLIVVWIMIGIRNLGKLNTIAMILLFALTVILCVAVFGSGGSEIMKKEWPDIEFDLMNMLIWVAGFVIYRALMQTDIPVGNTLPDMALTILICVTVRSFKG